MIKLNLITVGMLTKSIVSFAQMPIINPDNDWPWLKVLDEVKNECRWQKITDVYV